MFTINNPITGEKLQIALNDFEGNRADGRISSWYEANQVCKELGNGWRLPTSTELKEMFKQLHSNGKGNFKGFYCYWSSTESCDDNKKAYYVCFEDGSADSNGKQHPDYVRAVRTL